MASMLKQLLDGLSSAVSTVEGMPPPKIRKVLEVLEADYFPLCVIAPAADAGETIKEQTFAGDVFYEYPIAVALLDKSNRAFDVSEISLQELRERLRNRLTDTALITGVTGFLDVMVEALPPFVPIGANPGVNYDATGFVVTVMTNETR